ncbi:MAG: hypothetical protein ABIP55_09490 [Tepidisphaeraceae bacterium]
MIAAVATSWMAARGDEPPAATTKPAAKRLEISASIDGSDELHITAKGFRWVHKHWGWPGDIRLNGDQWDPQGDTEPLPLRHSGTGLLAADLRAENVTVLKRTGRDTVAVEANDDGIIIYFADSLAGGDTYGVTLEFAPSAPPAAAAPAKTTKPASNPAP